MTIRWKSTDEEIEQSYEEFYEDVHTEFLKFGELVNFKVCRNGSLHLRGNVYVHYKSLDSALLAYSRMNGRYFAGKQITCEFVAVTRWKVAICGEYMRSRFKTCSRGIACNFIHCFRNPGGDYKWADWDNPPPKYWIRKMAALFGPSDDTVYGKGSNTPHFDRSQSSDRRPRSSDPRSRDGDAHKQHSSRDYSHAKQECSSPTEHSRHRRESSASDKRRSRELKDKTGKYSCRMESERESHKNMREERHRSEYGDGGRGGHGKVRSRKNRSERQESLEPRSSHWPSDFSDADTTNSLSGSQSTDRHHRKSRRQSLEDLNLERHRSTSHKSTQEHNTSPRRSSRHRYKDDDSYDEKYDGRGQYVEHRDHHDASDDRWVATNSDVDSDLENRYHRSSSKGSKLERKVDGPSDAEIGYERSTTKSHRERKRRSGNSEHSNSEEDSDTRDTSSGAWRSRSRSSDENFSTHRSRRKRSRSSHDS